MGNIMDPIFIKEFLPSQLLNFAYSYSIIKYSNKTANMDHQTNSMHSEHGDYFMETLMDASTPVIEKNVGKKLFPTYSLGFMTKALIYKYIKTDHLVSIQLLYV